MTTILIPVPSSDFDPTEAAVPWQKLCAEDHAVVFATPDGKPAEADPRVVHGTGFGALAARLMADERAREAYAALLVSREFQRPVRWDEIAAAEFDALLLPGGHAPGMRPCLESPLLQAAVVEAFRRSKPVAAICHGVVLAARSQGANG